MASVTDNALSIGELARQSGLSPHTLRFYEAKGILRPAVRATSGHRRYRPEDVLWLEFVLRLKLTGMPLAEIRQYADLRARGDGTLAARLAMLELHRERLAARLKELSTCALVLDDKIRLYRRMITKARTPKGKAKT
ncbi:MAG TPA: MerR family transcriptional regulator [Rhodocyclaceae bacterium]|nr:MerR family transcriptional regulator [Rhodocyclaceae bacterium]